MLYYNIKDNKGCDRAKKNEPYTEAYDSVSTTYPLTATCLTYTKSGDITIKVDRP